MNFETEKIVVLSPKTARHPGKDRRVMPLFPELREFLYEAYDCAREGEEYVVGGDVGDHYRKKADTPKGWRNVNIRGHFERLFIRAGMKTWPAIFHAMRASRETELVKDGHPIHVVTSWLGNSPRVALKHYLMVTEDDFKKATQGSAKCSAQTAQNAAQHSQAPSSTNWKETTQPLERPRGYAKTCDGMPKRAIPSSGEDRIRTCGTV